MLTAHDLDIAAAQLAAYFLNSEGVAAPKIHQQPYHHMGATITDAVLQAGMNYKYVVYPRVLYLLHNFADFKTTCDFLILMQAVPLKELVRWKNERKLRSIATLTWLFQGADIQNEEELAQWLESDKNLNELLKVEGIGPKTIDYLKMLSGNQSIAIDRHLFKYLRLANITVSEYADAHAIYCVASQMLGIDLYSFDRIIWTAMSSNKC